MTRPSIPAFLDELAKIAGEQTVDRSYFLSVLDDATKTQKRGPHPALNFEHSWSK